MMDMPQREAKRPRASVVASIVLGALIACTIVLVILDVAGIYLPPSQWLFGFINVIFGISILSIFVGKKRGDK